MLKQKESHALVSIDHTAGAICLGGSMQQSTGCANARCAGD